MRSHQARLQLLTRISQRGMTLLELLVALVVVSLGLLGVSALQAKGMQSSNEAYYITQASFLAQSMIERIRANHNPAHSAASVYNTLATATTYASAPTPSKDCNATACTQGEMAAYDIKEWLKSVDDLPVAAASITWSGATATILIRWRGRFSAEGNCDSAGKTIGALKFRCFTLSTTFPT